MEESDVEGLQAEIIVEGTPEAATTTTVQPRPPKYTPQTPPEPYVTRSTEEAVRGGYYGPGT